MRKYLFSARRSRGQSFAIDIVMAIIVFSLLFVFFVDSWQMSVSSAQKAMKKNRMEFAALSATDMLIKSAGSGNAGSSGGFVADFTDPFNNLSAWSIGNGGHWSADGTAYSTDTWETNLYRIGAYNNDYIVMAKVQFNNGTGGGPVIQGVPGTNYVNGYCCRLISTGLQLTQLTNSAAWAIPGALYSGNVTPGSWYNVKAYANNTTKKCKYWAVGGTEPDWQINESRAGFTSGEYHGVYGKTGTKFDDFQQGHDEAGAVQNSTLSMAGFASAPYTLSSAKIAQFTVLNYSAQKSLLGMQEQFTFFIEDTNGVRLYEGGNFTAYSKVVVSITRYAVLNGNIVKLGVSVYG